MAILGLLGIDRWTPYELVQHMKRSTIQYIWPRAESKIYEEPKRLLASGYASKTADQGDPRRTRYGISPAGRHVLHEWLDRPGGGVSFESEGALKILFAENGTKEQLLATISAMRADALVHLGRRADVFDEVSRDGPPYPDRIHQSALVFELVQRLHTTVVEWSDFADERARQWPTLVPDEHMRSEALRLVHDLRDRARATVASHTAGPIVGEGVRESVPRAAAAL
jgi:DNA-binding PadR family transcriptional regulator